MRVVVTGGASFIGSHLVDKLLAQGHKVSVIDDLSSGSLANLPTGFKNGEMPWYGTDLRAIAPERLAIYFHRADIIYHLAADHGGRGYVELEQLACSNNFAIDNNVFQAAALAKVPAIIFASSGCIYPLRYQRTVGVTELKEDMDGLADGLDADGLYGYAKIMGELTLKHLYLERGIKSVSCRFFTVYGPRAKENHAIMSFIARAFTRQNPWVVWGDGRQIRNWTYVDDIVDGMLFAANNLDAEGGNPYALNLGTMERISVAKACQLTLEHVREVYYPDYRPALEHDLTKPVGPVSRVADNTRLLKMGGYIGTPFAEGLRKTIDWYFAHKDANEIAENLDRLLIARK